MVPALKFSVRIVAGEIDGADDKFVVPPLQNELLLAEAVTPIGRALMVTVALPVIELVHPVETLVAEMVYVPAAKAVGPNVNALPVPANVVVGDVDKV